MWEPRRGHRSPSCFVTARTCFHAVTYKSSRAPLTVAPAMTIRLARRAAARACERFVARPLTSVLPLLAWRARRHSREQTIRSGRPTNTPPRPHTPSAGGARPCNAPSAQRCTSPQPPRMLGPPTPRPLDPALLTPRAKPGTQTRVQVEPIERKPPLAARAQLLTGKSFHPHRRGRRL